MPYQTAHSDSGVAWPDRPFIWQRDNGPPGVTCLSMDRR